MDSTKAQELLENFICDTKLKELECLFGQFNIFDCLRLTRTEIRHSNFIAWLLDPNETHKLKDYFLKQFLIKVLSLNKKDLSKISGKELTLLSDEGKEIKETYFIPSIIDIDCWNMTETEVYRELENIDLLLVDEKNKFVLVIENKIDTCQHDNQLARYRDYVDVQYPSDEYKKLFIYLKPQKEKVELPYIFVSYQVIVDLIKNLLVEIKENSNQDVVTLIKHYQDILERDIMKEENIGTICAKIYKQHKAAIDLINKYGTPQKELGDILQEVLEEKDYLQCVVKESNSSYLCLPKDIKDKSKLAFGEWIKNHNYITALKFVNFRNNCNNIWIEILFAPVQHPKDTSKKDALIDFIQNIKFDKDNRGWVWSVPIELITLDEYLNYKSREEVKAHLSRRIDEEKNTYINALQNAINNAIDNNVL